MKGFDVLKVKSAVKSHNKFDLSRTHLTTMDFGQIVPLFSEETIPGDHFSIDGQYFSRMAPLVKPTYGKFEFKTVSGFVPYHQIAYDADAWLSGKTSWEGTTPKHRYFTVDTLFQFANSSLCSTDSIDPDPVDENNCDFQYIDEGGSVVYKRFTNKGRYFMKILNALGYTLPQGVNYDEASEPAWMGYRMTHLSAYPLLAFFKLYNDYMSQSQRFNTSSLTAILRAIKYNTVLSPWYSGNGVLTESTLRLMFNSLFLSYENDYFTSAWQKPNSPISSIESVSGITVPGTTNSGDSVDVTITSSDSVLSSTSGDSFTEIGQRALDFLKSFDDWVRRNNYSGSRAVQQIYSRFGIKTDDYKSHYAQVITTDSLPIQIGDITSTADTSGSNGASLGDYAGKGIVNGSKNISVKVSDYGLVIILGYYTVSPMMAYGLDKKVLRNSPLDYYNPEFDGLGAEAISVGEVWTSPIDSNVTVDDDAIFGFTERYNSYRFGRDMITGDFRSYRSTDGMNTWHSGRLLSELRDRGDLVAQTSSFNTLSQVDSEYNRIFSITTSDVDHFYMTCKFKVSAIRPMLNLNQVPRLGEGDTVVPRNGNTIS